MFEELWQLALTEYDRLKGIDWKWQSMEGAMTKSPLGGEKTGKNPTDRGKLGVKRSTLVDGRGVPLAVAVAGANVPDQKLVAETLHAIPIERLSPRLMNRNISVSTRATRASPLIVKFASEAIRLTFRPRRISRQSYSSAVYSLRLSDSTVELTAEAAGEQVSAHL